MISWLNIYKSPKAIEIVIPTISQFQGLRMCLFLCRVSTNYNLSRININLIQNNMFKSPRINIIFLSNYCFGKSSKLLLLQIMSCPNLNFFNYLSNTLILVCPLGLHIKPYKCLGCFVSAFIC